jgi:hypothetical protein
MFHGQITARINLRKADFITCMLEMSLFFYSRVLPQTKGGVGILLILDESFLFTETFAVL